MTGPALFQPVDGPRVFALPPGADFAARFLDGLDARLSGQPPEAAARVEIWVNTARTRRRLLALLENGPVRLLPRVRVLAALPQGDPGLPPELPPLRRRLELAQLVRTLIRAAPDLAARTAAYDLADSLAALLGEMQTEGLSGAAFGRIEAPEASGHWQRSLSFLQLLRDVLDAAPGQPLDPEARLRLAVLNRAAAWAAAPPAHPVIVAGSTGSRGATALFLDAVARLPQGAVVLPGLDADLPAEVWARLEDPAEAADHPQFGLAALGRRLGFDPRQVPAWVPGAAPSPPRNRLVSLSLRPAPVTDQWLSEGPALRPDLAAATAGLTLVEAPDPRAEAAAIAWTLRAALAEGRRAALVTPDRMLARRVAAALDRWNIAPDDSAGRPLDLTPPGVFLRLTAAAMDAPLSPVDLLSLLKHPLTASAARGPHMAAVARLEMDHLRDGPPFVDWDGLAAWAVENGSEDWAGWLRALFAAAANPTGAEPLTAHLSRHRAFAEALAAGPGATGPGDLWDRDAGRKALAAWSALEAQADHGGALDAAEYRALVDSILGSQDVPDAPYQPHPDLAIWGTLEARTQGAELVILGGLNEGVWPRLPRPDPWLSRGMRAQAGLPLPERRIGLSAHDYQQAMGAPQVVMTRAARSGGADTVPARWLLRLQGLLAGLPPEGKKSLDDMRARGAAILDAARAVESPAAPVPRAPRPAPLPPADARPARLSATRIETLIRDPYAIYASHVLGLRKLPDLGRAGDPAQRGTAFHAALERFIDATRDGLPEDAAALFRDVLSRTFADHAPFPSTRALWTARLAALAEWFVAGERDRRALADPFLSEAKGRLTLATPRPFTLEARADRIDRAADGSLAIYDYKTGAVPSKKQIGIFNKQLLLEALIARAGGFEGLPPGDIAALHYIGFPKGGEIRDALAESPDLDAVLADLLRLVAAYQSPDTPFPARLRPAHLKYESDYDHLSRKGEWDDGDPFEPVPVP